MTFRRWIDYNLDNRCYICKQKIKDVMQGLMNVGNMVHYNECPMKDFGHIESCPHCGKDLTGL